LVKVLRDALLAWVFWRKPAEEAVGGHFVGWDGC